MVSRLPGSPRPIGSEGERCGCEVEIPEPHRPLAYGDAALQLRGVRRVLLHRCALVPESFSRHLRKTRHLILFLGNGAKPRRVLTTDGLSLLPIDELTEPSLDLLPIARNVNARRRRRSETLHHIGATEPRLSSLDLRFMPFNAFLFSDLSEVQDCIRGSPSFADISWGNETFIGERRFGPPPVCIDTRYLHALVVKKELDG
jgi:hypothetical protein